MDKLKFAEWGERLKTGGAQMGRIVSGKMKEILASPTPESKIVDDATSETMEEPNWGMNLRICGMINSEEFSGSEVVKAIKKKISSKSGVSQRLSLDLLEACTMNCEKVFSEVASEKLLDEMVKMIENPQTDDENRERALQLIRAWGQSEDLAYLPVFRQTYVSLKERDTHIPNGNSNVHQQPSENYSVPDTEVDGAEHGTFAFNYGSLSVEQKKEFFEITRNSLEVLSSMLNIEEEPKPIQDDLTISMLEKCKNSQPVIQMIIESTTDDDILFEALHLHDELQRVISRCEELQAESKFGGQELEASSKSRGQLPENSGTAESNALSQVDTPNSSSMAESNDEKTERGEPQSSDGAHDASSKDETHGETETETKRDEPENEEQPWKKH